MRVRAKLIDFAILIAIALVLLLTSFDPGVNRTSLLTTVTGTICTPSRATVPGPLPPPEPQDSIEYPADPEPPARRRVQHDLLLRVTEAADPSRSSTNP
jgi:hypothetical protein